MTRTVSNSSLLSSWRSSLICTWQSVYKWLKKTLLNKCKTRDKSQSVCGSTLCTHQLLFHVCRTCGSWMLCLSACSSRKSNMYLMASGRALPRWAVLKMVSNRSSTNFCNVPCGTGRGDAYRMLTFLLIFSITNLIVADNTSTQTTEPGMSACVIHFATCCRVLTERLAECAVHVTLSPHCNVYVSCSYLTDLPPKSARSFDGQNCYFTAEF